MKMPVDSTPGVALSVGFRHTYRMVCIMPDGAERWSCEFHNLVPTVGKQKYLDSTLKTGSGGTPVWYLGLKGSGTPADTDTMASHATWSVITPYSDSTDPVWTPGTISGTSLDNSGSPASFTIDTDTMVYGALIKSSSTKGGTSGTLLGVGDSGSSKHVVPGDTLVVTLACEAL